MRTITLELLRHGPAHNQLLSPLTPYLSLCENHAAVTIHVPFEHNQLLFRLSALDYKQNNDARIFQLKDTAKVIGELLAMIPGLTAEISKESNNKNEQLTHLRLIISASELALLPFELAVSPNGFPGSGQHLLLQPQLPLCLTREIRRVPDSDLQWPKKHRILFVAASPPEVGLIPLESHLLTLRRAVNPWIKFFEDEESHQKHVEEHLNFLPAASIEAIEEKCSTGKYTHVHILAHGIERKENYDSRFFLALHQANDPNVTDYISGERLATALRSLNNQNDYRLSRPAVVTLACCNSGSIGSVAGAGSSIAHALHESGIPIVVANQFPLSFKGSVRLVECLYDGLLWGKDPRWLLFDLRRRLFSQFPDTHDWAGLTAYVSLPTDFENQLSDIQILQASRSIDAAMDHADKATIKTYETKTDKNNKIKEKETDSKISALLAQAREKIEEAKSKLEKLLTLFPHKSSEIHGLLASTEKRQAEVLYSSHDSKEELLKLLASAHDHYWESFQQDNSNSWAVVQYLSLALILKQINNRQYSPDQQKGRPEKDLESLWSLSYIISVNDIHHKDQTRALWAHGNLIELYLLVLLMDNKPENINGKTPLNCSLEHAHSLVEIADRNSFAVYSTRRQLMRYTGWYCDIAKIDDTFKKAVNEVIKVLPVEAQ